MIYQAILYLFPDISGSQFSLRDDSDGNGPYISAWTYPAPQPTQAELDAAILAVSAIAGIEAAHSRINLAYENAIYELTIDYPQAEIDSWPRQEAEARNRTGNSDAGMNWIKAASTARRISVDNLAARIIKKADQYAADHGALTGKRQRLRDAIDALGASPTQGQLDAIQW